MNYYEEIEHIIKRNEINKKAKQLEDNYDTLNTYWNIGRLIVEAQGGESRAKYGNELIKEWSIKLSKLYGKNYGERNLRYMRQFYNTFPIWKSVIAKLSWTHYIQLFPIKEENKRNYYINLCIENNLSVRELIKEIKSNSFERLINPPKVIEIKRNSPIEITSDIKNPIIINLKENEKIENHHDLEMKILSDFTFIFKQLGNGYALIGNEYKITVNKINYYIDILLFNYIFNRFVVIELKTRELRKEDKSQIRFYMDYIDKNIKQQFHNNTIGIIISKSHNKYIATFVSEEDIIPLTYELKKESEQICE